MRLIHLQRRFIYWKKRKPHATRKTQNSSRSGNMEYKYLQQRSPNSALEAQCPEEFSSKLNQTHLNQRIKVLLGILETSRQVCRGKLELNAAGHRPSRSKFGDPWSTANND